MLRSHFWLVATSLTNLGIEHFHQFFYLFERQRGRTSIHWLISQIPIRTEAEPG